MAAFRRAVASEPAHVECRKDAPVNATMIDPKSQACALICVAMTGANAAMSADLRRQSG
jgi:hypothetical protein